MTDAELETVLYEAARAVFGPPEDGMTDAELKALLRRLLRKWSEEITRTLLVGNDAQCFTTAQYVDGWVRIKDKGGIPSVTPRLAEMHLRSLPHLVREVRPGVWAAVETVPAPPHAVADDDGEAD